MVAINRTTKQAHDGQVIVGITKHMQNVPTPIALGGESFPTSDALAARLQQRIDLANQIVAARAQWLALGKAYQELDVTTNLVEHGIKQYVMNMFGQTSAVLADFGFTPPKRPIQTIEQKNAAIAKRAATRKARNTLGKKAKLAIKGVVPATAPATPVTPTTTPATPTTTPATPATTPATPTATVPVKPAVVTPLSPSPAT
jgi:hypothetical protein